MNERILLCDTNILRYLVDHPEKRTAFCSYLKKTQTVLVLSLIQVVELKKLPQYHEGLSKLLVGTRSALLKWWKQILKEESEIYPMTTAVDPVVRPFLSDMLHSPLELQALLDGYDIDVAWHALSNLKDNYMKALSWLSTTAPDRNASETDIDFMLHNYGVVVSELREINSAFLDTFREQPNNLSVELFPGSLTRAAYVYYRYILKGIDPQPSDIGDIHQVFYIPYCSEVIIEKSMAGILHQLRKQRGIAITTTIRSIRFIRQLSGD